MHILSMTPFEAMNFNTRFTKSYPDAPMFAYDSQGAGLAITDQWWSMANAMASVPFAATVDELKAYAADKRYRKEIGGITVSGLPIATDRESQGMLLGAFTMAQANPTFTTQWKTEDGSFVLIDAPTITILANSVAAHVSAMFSLESTVDAGITNGTLTTTAQIDALFI